MTVKPSPLEAIRTTHGIIALSHLQGQIAGLEHRSSSMKMASQDWVTFIDLLVLRGQILGRVADYERASEFADRRAMAASCDGPAFLARARTRASLHCFADAMTDLDRAVELGAPSEDVNAERAALLQATGRYSEAMAIRRRTDDVAPGFESAAGLASLYAEIGDTDAAEHWFDESCRRYRSVSPFALAQLEFQRGHMWMGRDLERARWWLTISTKRLPFFAQAAGHLAEVEYTLGLPASAIASLKGLAAEADDPDYAAELARIFRESGCEDEADHWLCQARAGYEELIARHPAAFADHGARFWLGVGADPGRAVDLARLNLSIRDTPSARRLFAAALAIAQSEPAGARSGETTPRMSSPVDPSTSRLD